MKQPNDTKDIYYKYIKFNNIESIYDIVRKTCKDKKGVFRFTLNKDINIYNICKILYQKKYKPYPYKLFLVFEPKPRLVMSQTVSDKIVNHFVAEYYLLPFLEKKLIDSNVATRKEKGSKHALKLIEDYINEIRIKYPNKEIYVLKLDISKYFYNINHEILIEKLRRDIKDENVIELIKIIINETNSPYINKTIDILNEKYNIEIPYYEKGVGLSIGAMTSQFFAIYYLSDLDHYIKEVLKAKYYIRYMDDFVIFDTSYDRLKKYWKCIEIKVNKLKLKVNPKSNIYKLSHGISFVGYRYFINSKFKVKYRNSTIRRINKKLKILKEKDLKKYYTSYASYYGYLSKIDKKERDFKMKAKEKYIHYKNLHQNSIVLIKEGSFYKTYDDDAILMWHLFNYKWNKDSIAFGVSPQNKVFDELRKKNISYFLVNDREVLIKGNDEVYDLYLKLSKINYDAFCKKKDLKERLYCLLDNNINCFNEIDSFFKKLENSYEK